MPAVGKDMQKYLLPLNFALVLTWLLMAGCDSNPFISSTPTDPPVVSAIEPDSGTHGTKVTVKGEHFSSHLHDNTVRFNETKAEVTKATSLELVAIVPKRAGTGPVEVAVNDKSVKGPVFKYIWSVKVETWAGSSKGHIDATGTNAKFNDPWGIDVNNRGTLYIGDSDNYVIRKIDNSKNVSTLAGGGYPGYIDGIGENALFSQPMGLALSPQGILFVVDSFNHVIRTIDEQDEKVETFAGTGFRGFKEGQRKQAQFFSPSDIAISTERIIYVTDAYNFKIRKIDQHGMVETLTGSGRRGYKDGHAETTEFVLPLSLALGPKEEFLYVVDFYAHRIRSIDVNTGFVSTLAGTGEPGFKDGAVKQAEFNRPAGIAVDAKGIIYISDSGNHAIRMIENNRVITLAGDGEPGHKDGKGSSARFNTPYHLVASSSGNFLYVSDWKNHKIRRITLK